MGRIFVSHSSKNNAEVVAICEWLKTRGWDDFFVDFDARAGIVPGGDWEDELRKAAATCDLIMFLFSREWLDSSWCQAEYATARFNRKPLLGVFIDDTDIALSPLKDRQNIRLRQPPLNWITTVVVPRTANKVQVAFSESGLAELELGIRAAQIDASYFDWPPKDDPNRSPYPGFRPLEAEDAGIFFGRDGDLLQALDGLQDLHGRPTPRVATILGASGAGKSSFLRAGLLPRLARDSRRFLTLRPIRPAPSAITGKDGFATILHETLVKRGQEISFSTVESSIDAGAAQTAELIASLRPEATDRLMVVISVDQAEELLNTAENDEPRALLELLVALAKQPDALIMLILCVRSDRYAALQDAVDWGDGSKPHLIDLSPIPIGRYGEIILAPAARMTAGGRKLVVEEALVQALLADIQEGAGADALPLLAFILERLFRRFRAGDTLRLDDYRGPKFNGIAGAITSAVDEALAKPNPEIPRERAAQLPLLRRGLIPWLANIDPDSRTARRRVAMQSEVPKEAWPLMGHLVEQHLLVADVEKIVDPKTKAVKEVPTIEPSHEALLRQWGLLDSWLKEDSFDLAQIEGVRRAASEWEANGRRRDFLVHDGARLDLATAALVSEKTKYPDYVREMDRDYVRASRLQRLGRRVAIAAAALVVLGIGTWVYLTVSDRDRTANASNLVAASESAVREGDDLQALTSVRAALRMKDNLVTRTAAASVLMKLSPNLVGLYKPDGRIDDVAWGSAAGPVLVWHSGEGADADPRYLQQIDMSDGHRPQAPVRLDLVAQDAFATPDGIGVVGRDGAAIARFDFAGKPGGQLPGVPNFQPGAQQVDTSTDGSVIAIASNIGEVLVRVCTDGCVDRPLAAGPPAKSLALTPDGNRLAVGREDGAIDFYDAPFEQEAFHSHPGAGAVMRIDWSSNAEFLAVGREDQPVEILKVHDKGATKTTALGDSTGKGPLQWAPVGQTLATTCSAVDLCIYPVPGDVPEGAEIVPSHVLAGHRTEPVSLAWNAAATGLVSFAIGANDGLRIWSLVEDRERWLDLPAGPSTQLTSLAVDRSRDVVAAGDDDGVIWTWRAGGLRHRIPVPDGIHPAKVSSLAFLASGELAAIYENAAILVWALGDTPTVTHCWAPGQQPTATDCVVPDEYLDFNRIEAFGQGRGLASSLADGRLVVFDGSAFRLEALTAQAFGLAAAIESDAVFLSLADGSIEKRDPFNPAESVSVVDGQVEVCASPPPQNNGARSLDVSPDGKLLTAARTDAIVAVYDTATPSQPSHCLRLIDRNSITVAFSGSSRELAVLTKAGVSVFDLQQADIPFVLGASTGPGATGSSPAWIEWYDDDTLLMAQENRVIPIDMRPTTWLKRMDSVAIEE